MNGTKGGEGVGCGADSPSSLYTKETYIKILEQLANTDKTARNISKELSVSSIVITKVSNGTRHSWLAVEFPELWQKVKDKKGLRSSCNKSLITYPAIKSPEGMIFTVLNIRSFARDNNLHNGSLGEVLRGTAKSHKGWTLA